MIDDYFYDEEELLEPEAQEIEPLVTLTKPQTKIFKDDSRFRVVVAGRRFGKTFLAIGELSRAAMNKPNAYCWYLAPTRS